jgi:ABC-2 type transport system permease protein/lipopolysaccharide transport system permease protein
VVDVRRPATTADGPPKDSIFRRRLGPRRAAHDLWRARQLLEALARREYRARYNQTSLGMAWAVITPLLLMLVFTVFVRRFAQIETGGVPYPVFAYLGLLPWSCFSTACSRGGTILVLESSLVNKVRCPREVFPLATIAIALVDMAISVGVLGVIMLVSGVAPTVEVVWVPLILLVQVVFIIGMVLLLAIAIIYVRDLGQALPLVLQLGLFATPVAYAASTITERVGTWYAVFNPLVGVIESYRACVVEGSPPPWELFGPSAAGALLYLLAGATVFKRYEVGIADVA